MIDGRRAAHSRHDTIDGDPALCELTRKRGELFSGRCARERNAAARRSTTASSLRSLLRRRNSRSSSFSSRAVPSTSSVSTYFSPKPATERASLNAEVFRDLHDRNFKVAVLGDFHDIVAELFWASRWHRLIPPDHPNLAMMNDTYTCADRSGRQNLRHFRRGPNPCAPRDTKFIVLQPPELPR